MLTRTNHDPASTADATSVVRLDNLSKTYAGGVVRAVDDLSLRIAPGEVLTLLGPSGCGKTTTLRMVAGLETPDFGTIYFADEPIFDRAKRVSLAPEKRNLGMMFQSYGLWPHMTVGEKRFMFRCDALAVRPRREIDGHVEALCSNLVGLGGMRDRPATALSGGQQQRAALGRALIVEPKVLVAG